MPAPPGAEPPAPAAPPQPQIPDASQDPFGAMNAIASATAATAAPDIVVVNDGKPVENLGKAAKGGGLVKYVVIGLVCVVLGVVIGQTGTKAAIYNETIADAGMIAKEVSRIDKDLQQLRNILYSAKERGPGGASYAIVDEKLTSELEALELTLPDLTKVYESNLYEMDQGVVDQTLVFLTESQLLYREIKEHVTKAKEEARALSAGEDRIKKFGMPSRYGIYYQIEKDKPITARFVELGDPLCEGGNPNPAGCGDAQPSGFLYRENELGAWSKMELAVQGGAVGRRLVPLAFTQSPSLKALFYGPDATLSELAYRKRIEEIDAKVDELMNTAKNLRKTLTATANRGTQFTFFL